LADAVLRRATSFGADDQKSEEHCVENPQPNMTAIEKTDEEIWWAIRDLDPDQRRRTSHVACVIAIAVAGCVVLPDPRGLQVIGKIATGSTTMIRKMRDTACCLSILHGDCDTLVSLRIMCDRFSWSVALKNHCSA